MYKGKELINIQETILHKLENGESLNKICQSKNLPNKDTIYQWLKKDKKFSDNYARAKDVGLIRLSVDIMEIADNVGLTREEIQKATLQIDTRKWLLSKLMPKKYGANMAQTNIQINTEQITGMTIQGIEDQKKGRDNEAIDLDKNNSG